MLFFYKIYQKVVGVYNHNFAVKHKKELNNVLTQLTLQLKGQMKDKFFKTCYKHFMIVVVKEMGHLTPDQLHHDRKTAHEFIVKYFNPELKKLHAKDAKKKLTSKYPPLKKIKPTKLKHIK